MITKTFLKNAYEKGLVRLMLSPNMDGIVCAIGENWFYFGGETAEEYDTVEAYKQDIPKETFLDEIYRTLEDFREDSTFADEYAYYDLFLSEWGFRDKPMEEMSVQEFVLAYPTLASAIRDELDNRSYREDLVTYIPEVEELGVTAEDFSEKEISDLVAKFKTALDCNDSFWDCYWLTAAEVMKEAAKAKKAGAAAPTDVAESSDDGENSDLTVAAERLAHFNRSEAIPADDVYKNLGISEEDLKKCGEVELE